MNPLLPTGGSAVAIIAIAGRWLLGGFFIYTGLKKALEPAEFLRLARQYDLLDTPLLLNSVAALLPWFEVFCGLLLVTGVAVRGAALLVAAMLVPFTLAILGRALELQAERAIPFCAVRFDCGCGTGEVLACFKLVENALWTVLALWLAFFSHGRRWCLRHSILTAGRS